MNRANTESRRPPFPDDAWPTVGRAALIESARDTLLGRGAVLMGEPGSGKSTVLHAAVPQPTLRIVATPGTSEVAHWLCHVLGIDGSEVTLGPSWMLGRLQELHRGAGTPVLAIEAIDFLDEASLGTLLHLVSNGHVRVMATRSHDRVARPAIEALWQDAGVRRIEVPPLDEDDVADLLRAVLGGPVDGRGVSQLDAVAQGNPFVIRELVTSAHHAGSFERRGEILRLVSDPPVTHRLRERVEAALMDLSPVQREAVELLSFARALPLPVVTALVNVVDLEALERCGFVRVEAEPQVVLLASSLVRWVLSTTLPALTARRFARELCSALDDQPGQVEAVEPLASLWRVVADLRTDPDRLLAGARAALAGSDPRLAERLAHEAVAGSGGTEAVLLESWCVAERGGGVAATELLLAHDPVSDDGRAAVAIRVAEQRFWVERDRELAQQALDTMVDHAAEPWPLAAEMQANVFACLDGDPGRAATEALPYVEHAEPLIASTAALAAGLGLAMIDRPDEGEAVARGALNRLGQADDTLYVDPGVHVISLGYCLVGAGRIPEAEELTEAVYRVARARPGVQAQGWSALLRSQVLLAAGSPLRAAEMALEAESIWMVAGLEGLARWSATAAAIAYAEVADVASLDLALERAGRYRVGPFRLFDAEYVRAQAWSEFLHGQPGAIALFGAAAELAGKHGCGTLAAAAGHDLTRVGRPADAVGVLEQLPHPGPVSLLRLRLACAARDGDNRELVEIAECCIRIGAEGLGAEALALTQARRAFAPHPDHARARALVATSGLATPPITKIPADHAAGTLTAREAEIAWLVAGGSTNREIAERLVVSRRTVENHLHRAFAKLSVQSRAELKTRLGPDQVAAAGLRRLTE